MVNINLRNDLHVLFDISSYFYSRNRRSGMFSISQSYNAVESREIAIIKNCMVTEVTSVSEYSHLYATSMPITSICKNIKLATTRNHIKSMASSEDEVTRELSYQLVANLIRSHKLEWYGKTSTRKSKNIICKSQKETNRAFLRGSQLANQNKRRHAR